MNRPPETLAGTIEAQAIRDAHPLRTGRHDLYAEASRFVGERDGKGDLIDLVNWLLAQLDTAQKDTAEVIRRYEEERRKDHAVLAHLALVAVIAERVSKEPPSDPLAFHAEGLKAWSEDMTALREAVGTARKAGAL